MSEWRRVRLGDVASAVTVGHVGPMVNEYRRDGVPFLRSQNVRPHRIDLNEIKYINEGFHISLRKSALHPGDVVTVRTGTPGTTAVIPITIPVANCSDLVITRPGPDLSSGWLSYYLNWVIKSHIAGHLVGAVQQHFNVKSAKNLELLLPDIDEQQAIAEVLGALDDKIAANQSLTDAAVSLVDAEYERCSRKSVLSELTYGNVADVGGGGTPRTSVEEYWDGSVPWATPTDVTALRGPYLTKTSRAISGTGLASCSSPLYPPGSILMTSRATIGAFAIAQQSMAVNQGFIVVNAHEADWQWWLFHDMRSRVDEFVSHANGATFLELSRGKFKQFRVRLVDGAALKEFTDFAGSVHVRAGAAMVESVQLAATRDTLLPQLMSGSIRIKDAERLVGEVI